MPRCSRRSLLHSGAIGATTALAGCFGGRSVSFETWTPAEGAWPLARYDQSNSGHNPNATPPRGDVEAAWTVETPVSATGLVVANGLLTAYGEQGLVVIRTSDRRNVLEELVPARVAGIGPTSDDGLRLYAAGPLGVREGSYVQLIRGWEYTEDDFSQSVWRTYEKGDSRGPSGLVADSESVYVGHYSETDNQLVAFDAESADKGWQIQGQYPTLTDESLFASGVSGVTRYRPRAGLDASLNGGPRQTWSTNYAGETVPAVENERVVVGGEWSQARATPTLLGYDVETGDELWDPPTFEGTANAPAVRGDTVYLSSYRYEDFGDYYLPNSGAIRAVDLESGSVTWKRETDWVQGPAVVGNNDVIITHGGYPEGEAYTGTRDGEGGRVQAHDAESGEVLWTFSTSKYVDSVALVDSTVYAGSRGGAVYALRAT